MEHRVASRSEAAVLRIFLDARAACQAVPETAQEQAAIGEEIFQVLKPQAVRGMAAVKAFAIGRCQEAQAEAARLARPEMPAAGRTPRRASAAAARRAAAVPARWPSKPG